MGKLLHTAIFTEKATGKVIYRLNTRNVLGKYFWEKEKALVLKKLIKDRFLDEKDIKVVDYTGTDDVSGSE